MTPIGARRRMRRGYQRKPVLRGSILISGVAVALLAAGCSTSSGTTGTTDSSSGGSKVITIAYPGDLESWSPYATIDSFTYSRWSNIYEPLVKYLNGKYIPVLATSWKLSGSVWTFQLRKNVKFQDGQSFTSADVVHTFDRAANDKTSLMQSHTAEIKKVVAAGPNVVKFYTDGPNAVLLANLTSVFVTSKATYDKSGAATADEHPNGTGPYSFVSWQKGVSFTVKKNPHYWGPEPADMPTEMIFKVIPNPTDAVAALKSGAVDIVPNLPFQDVPTIDSSGDTRVITVPGTRTMFYGFNAKIPPFNNVQLRQAITYAIDVPSIIKHVLDNVVTPMNGPVPANIYGSDPDSHNPYPYNPAKAKQIIKQAGLTGTTVPLSTTNGVTPGDTDVAQAIQQELQSVGLKVPIKVQDEATSTTELAAGKLAFYAGDRGNYFDASVFLSQYFTSPVDIRTGYVNPKVNKLMDESNGQLNPAERLATLHRAEALIMKDAPAVFFGAYKDIYGVSSRIASWKPTADEFIRGISISVK